MEPIGVREYFDEKPSSSCLSGREYIGFAMKRTHDQNPSPLRLAKASDS
jgi:hypothetical protein